MSRVGFALALLLAACGTVGYEATVETNPQADAQSGEGPDAQFVCGSDTILCENFDGDLSRWVEVPGEGEILLEAAGARSGQALHIHHPGTSVTVLTYALPEFGTLYARTWINVAPGDDLGDWAVFMEVRQDPDFKEKISFDGVRDNRLQVVSTADRMGVSAVGEVGSLPRGEWFCAELFVVLGDPGVAWVQANGTRVELPSDTSLVASRDRFNIFQIGIATSGIGLEATFDDVLVSSTYQGCGP